MLIPRTLLLIPLFAGWDLTRFPRRCSGPRKAEERSGNEMLTHGHPGNGGYEELEETARATETTQTIVTRQGIDRVRDARRVHPF